jgi:hypothetical protein
MSTSLRSMLLIALPVALILGAGCIFSPEDDPNEEEPPNPDPILPNTSGANIIENLQTIYEDKVRDASQRYELYQDLFADLNEHPDLAFIFHFQQADIDAGLPPSWGLDSELEVHRNMFQAQDNGAIFSLELAIQHGPEGPLEFPDPGQEDWTQIQATNVNLRLLQTPTDGFEVNAGQADFTFAPADDREYLVEWRDRPRP